MILRASLLAAVCGLTLPAMAAQSASGAIAGAAKPAAVAPADTITAAAPASPPEAGAAPAATPVAQATPSPTPPPPPAATPEQQAALAGARPAAEVKLADAPSATGSLLQTTLALLVVVGLLAGLAWLLKRFGPRPASGGANVRLVGALNVGTRERILVVEVGEQWIVVGASPGRMNALATMPRQEHAPDLSGAGVGATGGPGALPPGASFAQWFKQTIEKRHGK